MTQPIALIVGSLHHDIVVEGSHLPRRDETAVGRRWYPKFGGKGGNQAVAVARKGVRARMLGAVGDDGFGTFLRQGLRAGGVEDAHVATLTGVGSGMSVAIMDDAGDYAATIVSGANLCIDPAALMDIALWQDVGLLILQNEVAPDLNLAAARAARARGIRTVLNAAPARDLDAGLVPLIDVLVVNAVEAQMMGTDAVTSLHSAAHAAGQLAARFATVIVTAGAQGLAARGADGLQVILPAEPVQVVSSHGAGDAFIGALAAALLRGADLQQACSAASHAAALHVSGATEALSPR